jgi:hypothetical protein
MNALTIRIALMAAATLAVSTVSRNAEAQTRLVAGLDFSPTGSWNIAESQAQAFGFTPQVAYSSYRGLIRCCTFNNNCTFKRDAGSGSMLATETDPYVIGTNTAFFGLTANSDGSPKRYGFDLTANCVLTFGPGGVMPFKGSSNIRPARFTLTVTKF